MMLHMLAAIARRDCEDRLRRQAQGIAKAKENGAYRGRPEDAKRSAAILQVLRGGQKWRDIAAATDCSMSSLLRLAKRLADEPRKGSPEFRPVQLKQA